MKQPRKPPTEATRIKDRARAIAWNEKNKERAEQHRKNYRARNAEAIRERAAEKYKANPEIAKETVRNHRKRNPWYYHFYGARYRCESPKCVSYKYYGAKGITFQLTMEEVKALWIRDRAAELRAPSLDRLDSSQGYIWGNCRFIELSENSSRKHDVKRKYALSAQQRFRIAYYKENPSRKNFLL